ncbi:MAG: hypothetical protein K0U41_04945, partial [Gammaproteobacteria bacterium]|nr:hypothetical protein [Gammaproteobacteria bacterium]
MEQAIRDTLKGKAIKLAEQCLARVGGDWAGYTHHEGMLVEYPRDGVLLFKRPTKPNFAHIQFSNISPSKVSSSVFEPPTLLGNDVID